MYGRPFILMKGYYIHSLLCLPGEKNAKVLKNKAKSNILSVTNEQGLLAQQPSHYFDV